VTADLTSYGRHLVEDDDVAAVSAVLRGDRLTTGSTIDAFEQAFADRVGADHAVVCNSGTAALYLAARAAGLKPGDAVIVPSMTFVATASANVLAGIDVVFADVDPDTGLMQVEHAAAALERSKGLRIKAVFPVHLSGKVDDPPSLKRFADAHGLAVIEDACHALGTRYENEAVPVGSCAHSKASCFSFHPVKTIAMGEGGAITTNDSTMADRARRLRNHGMVREPADFTNADLAYAADGIVNPWYYEVAEISHNFRVSDINCALGLSQLQKLGRFLSARQKLVARYRARLRVLAPLVRAVPEAKSVKTGWHLFCVLVDFDALGIDRKAVMERLRAKGIGSQVHYIPAHLHPYYRARFPSLELPGALAYYRRTLSLPLFASMTEADVDRVVDALQEVLQGMVCHNDRCH
jgi:UDP-4-amino-4,6-dideoxy-N-acetyl-beta-L-altrosamine transaminase